MDRERAEKWLLGIGVRGSMLESLLDVLADVRAEERAAIRVEERAKLETLAKDAAASAIRATATLLATMERAERLAEAVRRLLYCTIDDDDQHLAALAKDALAAWDEGK